MHVLNCMAICSHGLSKIIAKQFPYSCEYEKPIGNRNVAVENGRPQPKPIQVFSGNGPTVICLFSIFQYGMPHEHYVLGVDDSFDMTENQLKGFRQCMHKVGMYFENVDDKHIAAPFRLGCCNAGGQWKNYKRVLLDFELEYGVSITLYQ